MKKVDEKRSAAFIIQIQFGPDTNEEKMDQIQKLYPEKTEAQLKNFYKNLEDAESTGVGMCDQIFQEAKKPYSDPMAADPAMYAALEKKLPWMTKGAMDYIVFRVHYYDFHG